MEISEELVRRLDVAGPRYTSYPTVPEWNDRFGSDDFGAALERASATPDAPLSLYVHLPFCREMCRYCGCNVVATHDQTRADRYLDVIEREVQLAAAHLGKRRSVSRLHLGGGTPTFLDEQQLTRLWRILSDKFTLRADAEVALEIDPVVTRRSQLELLRGFGWSRVSLGVQDFDPRVQEAVARVQTLAETRAILDDARALGYRSINLDLIYGLPRQTLDSWSRTLAEVIALAPDRVAVFSFAYVPHLKPHQRLLPQVDLPTGATKLALYLRAHELLTAAGYLAVGMDHFARPEDPLGRAARAHTLWRDFQGYTNGWAGDTVGFGASSISDVGGAYAQNEHTLSAHAHSIGSGRFATQRGLILSDDDRRRRAVITQLLCNFEIDLGDEVARYRDELAALAPLEKDGLVEREGARLRVTPLGRLFVRNVAMVFDAYLDRAPTQRRVFSRTV